MGVPLRAAFALALTAPGLAHAQGRVPDRQIPPAVLAEVRHLESRFDVALAADCDASRCFSKGCTYVDHAVADRPRARSLPGLSADPGPGGVEPQEYLTRARCAFAHEESVGAPEVAALSRRLASKVSVGWTAVTVEHERLPPLPGSLLDPHAPEAEEEAPAVPPEPARPEPGAFARAARELWEVLLPHFAWMIAIGLLTLAGAVLIWAWRRVGRASIEEQMLLAELGREPEAAPAPEAAEPPADDAFVAEQRALWAARLARAGDRPDPEIEALVAELLRAGELDLLARAVLAFPDALPAAFPSGGELASAKLALAERLEAAGPDAAPDAAFFRELNRRSLAASVLAQSDARVVRALRDEFGAAGLASLIDELDARTGALLFALAPADAQREVARQLPPAVLAGLAAMLLRSNRMDPAETERLFDVVAAARANRPLPDEPTSSEVTDRGAAFDAAGALSVLLERVDRAGRAALFGEAVRRSGGSLPGWTRGVLVADMLFALPGEARADLLLEVDVEPLAAWMSLLDPSARERVADAMPGALRATVGAAANSSRARQLALAEQGRRELAAGLQRQLTRLGLSFERVAQADAGGGA